MFTLPILLLSPTFACGSVCAHLFVTNRANLRGFDRV